MNDELTMSVSPVLVDKAGNKYACVSFTDGVRSAEGRIPECVITDNKGFSKIEIASIEDYMRKERTALKKMAASTNPFRAMMK